MIRGVIFDLDGVLVTTDELHYEAWKRLAEEEGIPYDRTVQDRQRGVSRMESLEAMLEGTGRAYTAEQKTEMAERKNTYYGRLVENLTPAALLPGAMGMLRALRRRGVKVAIASASKNTRTILERTGLAGKADAVVDGHDITRSKPDPEICLIAAERLGLEPAECLVVEDAPAGIEAGRRAGMAVFGVGRREVLPDVKHFAPDLAKVTPEGLLAAGEDISRQR